MGGPDNERRSFCAAETCDPGKGCQAGDSSFRRAGYLAIDSVNGNVASTAQTYMKCSQADAVVSQELRVAGAKASALQRAMRRGGWSMSTADAELTEAGSYSSGVGVAVRSHIGLAVRPVHIGVGAGFRFHLRWVGAYARGGFHLGSLHLDVQKVRPRRTSICCKL